MTLEEIPPTAKDLWMLSTGTAIGPFLSLLEQLQQQETPLPFKHLILVHAVRTQADLTYQERIQTFIQHFQGTASLCANYFTRIRYRSFARTNPKSVTWRRP